MIAIVDLGVVRIGLLWEGSYRLYGLGLRAFNRSDRSGSFIAGP